MHWLLWTWGRVGLKADPDEVTKRKILLLAGNVILFIHPMALWEALLNVRWLVKLYKYRRNYKLINRGDYYLWDITPCSPLKVKRRFGRTYRLHLQVRRISRARNQRESRWQAELYSFFDPEDGGDMLLRNVCWISTDYTALYPRR
jgi:hypothetical protein